MKENITRRDALRALGHLALSTTALGVLPGCDQPGEEREPSAGKGLGTAALDDDPRPYRELRLPNVHAYAQKSVFAGDTLEFRISNTVPYEMAIVRLGWTVSGPDRDWIIHRFEDVSAPDPQVIRPGSYVDIANALPADESLPEMTLECWVRAYRDDWQGLISQHTYPTACGFGLFLSAGGVAAYFGDGGAYNEAGFVSSSPGVADQQWHHVAATFSSGTVTLWVDGQRRATQGGAPPSVRPGGAPLRLANYGGPGDRSFSLDGDLAMPVIHSRALGEDEIRSRATTKPANVPTGPGVIACWPFSEESGPIVHDVGPAGRHGTIVNHATWMIGGPGYVGPSDRHVPYDPQKDATRGHGLRFASDDLYDCAWRVTRRYTVPRDLPPGVYVGRITYTPEGSSDKVPYDVTFLVRRPQDKPAAPILVLCSTNTWLAYNVPFPMNPWARDGWGLGGSGVTVAGAPWVNMYNDHRFPMAAPGGESIGRPTYQVGVNVPWGIAAPYVRYFDDYSHLVRAERYLHVWLEKNGYDFDIAGDTDLDRDPTLLDRYETVIVNGHSEYWSGPAYETLQRHLEAGGNLIVASGNTMFWRVSFNADASIMECRKVPSSVGGSKQATVGELYHSHDGKRGGLLRECGHPEWRLTGLECVGYVRGLHQPFRVAAEGVGHFLYRSPEPIAVAIGTEIGGPIGHEYDVRVTSLPDEHPTPPSQEYNPVLLAERGEAPVVGDYFDYKAVMLKNRSGPISEMIYHERPEGGRVLAAGSIATGRGVAEDPKMGMLMRNVLHEFGAAHRLELFTLDSNRRLRSKSLAGTAWGAWQDLGGTLQGAPVGVSFGAGRIAVMAIDAAGRLAYKWRDGATWQPSPQGITDLGGQLRDSPCAVGWGGGRFNIFARAANGEILNKWWDGTAWGPSVTEWQSLGGTGTGSPAATAWHGHRLSVAALSANGNVLYKWWDGERWNPSVEAWTDMGGPMKFGPTLVSWGGNRMDVFAVDQNGQLMNKRWDGQNWLPSLTGWQGLGGVLAGAPVVAVRDGDQFTIFALWQDGTVRAKWWDGQNWGPSLTEWQTLGGNLVSGPAAVAWRGGSVSLLGIAPDGRAQYKWWDGARWSPSDTTWEDFGEGLASGAAALAWVGPR